MTPVTRRLPVFGNHSGRVDTWKNTVGHESTGGHSDMTDIEMSDEAIGRSKKVSERLDDS